MRNIFKKCFHDLIYCREDFNIFKNRIKPDNILIVADFDYTLTNKYQKKNRTTASTTISMLVHSKNISDKFKSNNKKLFEEFHSYELNTSIDINIRKEKIATWFIENLKIIVDEKINKQLFHTIALENSLKVNFRTGFDIFLKLILQKRIPFYIITAGLKDSVDALLRRDHGIIYEALLREGLIKLFGNSLIYDHHNIGVDYTELVTTFNKGEIIKNKIEHQKIQSMMLGDHIWDVKALDFLEGDKFKVGFGNFNGRNLNKCPLYEEFCKVYDLTIINDGSFHPVIDLFN